MIMRQADSPATGFRPFFNPATGEWITYTALAEDNDGQLVRSSWRSVPVQLEQRSRRGDHRAHPSPPGGALHHRGR
jgi:hypothetical protein